MRSITDISDRGKAVLARQGAADIAVVAIIILTGFSGFGLGMLAGAQQQDGHVRMVRASSSPAADALRSHLTTPAGLVVASEHGSRYHFPWCSGARRMKAENMVWYGTIEAARDDGYTPAQNCPGLE